MNAKNVRSKLCCPSSKIFSWW